MRGDLRGICRKRIKNHAQHELDKWRRIRLMCAFLQSLVILGLVLVHQTFHRNISKQRVPACQNQTLPQPPHASIAIRKRMDELELIMEHRTSHQRMRLRHGQPAEQIRHQTRHTFSLRCHVNHLRPRHHAHTAAPIPARLINQPKHQHTMRVQQIRLKLRPPRRKMLIRCQRITHFQHLTRRSNHPFAVQNRRNLRFA